MEVVALEAKGAKFPEIQPLVSGARGRQVYINGDVDAGIWTCGISVGLINDVVSCASCDSTQTIYDTNHCHFL
jgi:hypothetical protein